MMLANRLNRGMWARPVTTGPVAAEWRQVELTRRTTRTTKSGHTEEAIAVVFTNGDVQVVHPASEWDIDMAASA